MTCRCDTPINVMRVDTNTLVKYRGKHREIAWEVSAHNFKEPQSTFDFKMMWATYLLLTPERFEEWKHKIDRAPWNGGITYERKITEEHYTAPADMVEKFNWNKPYYRIGDDFTHLWDSENFRHHMYDREYMERHIKKVIDWLFDGTLED